MIDGGQRQVEVRGFAATNQMSLDELGAWLSPFPPGSKGAPAHLEAPPVADLAVEVEVQLHHQEAVLGPGQTRGAATVRRRHVTGAVEVAKVVVSCGRAETVALLAGWRRILQCRVDAESLVTLRPGPVRPGPV